jgi:predicted secreted acid phosphatase
MEANFNAADMRMLQSLTSKKGQLAVLSEQLDHFGLDARSRKQELSDYYNLMLAMGETLAPFCNISAAKMKDELTAVLRPYYQTNGAARDAAGSATCLMIFYGWKTGLLAPGAPKKSVERMSDVFERILAGEDFWTFDPYQFEPKDKI